MRKILTFTLPALALALALTLSAAPADAVLDAPATLDQSHSAPLTPPKTPAPTNQADRYRSYCQTNACTGSYDHDKLPMENKALEQQMEQQRNGVYGVPH